MAADGGSGAGNEKMAAIKRGKWSDVLSADFVIIGGGVIGLSTAQTLLQAGYRVTLLDRGLVGQESSWAGAGILSPLCPWDYPNEVTQLTTRGAALFSAWAQMLFAETGIDPEYEVSGMLILPPFDLALARQWCAVHEVVLNSGGEESLLLPHVAQVRNPRLIQALRNHVEMLGGNIVEQCEVRGISVNASSVQSITTSRGEFNADNFIVSAGAWSTQVLGQYALQLDIKPMRGQMLLYKFDSPPLRNIVLQEGMYIIPRRDGHVLVGSTLEDVGFDKSTTDTARDLLRQRAELLLPALRGMSIIKHWSGLRPASPNNIPTIGRHPQLENLYINSGHFRYGVTMAPASAEILLNEITGAPQALEVAPYQMR